MNALFVKSLQLFSRIVRVFVKCYFHFIATVMLHFKFTPVYPSRTFSRF